MKDVYTLADLRNWSAVTREEQPPLRLAVLGDPVAHSRSPQMHNAALERLGIAARYCRLQIRPEELEEALGLLPAAGFLGVNLTIPHKQAALSLVRDVEEGARRLGAINTVLVENGELLGFNTDGPGLVRAIRSEFSVDLRDLRVMILGAGGGAGRAIAVQCGLEHCERLILVNRTLEKAEALRAELEPCFGGEKLVGPAARLLALPWEEERIALELQQTDLVINATSVGMKRTDRSPLPASILLPHLMVYDTIYTAHRTPFLRAGEAVGARVANGLGMLLEQGMLSFELWFNREAPREAMREGLLAPS